MKKLFISLFGVSLMFLGIGGIMERVGAQLKSDDKALDLIKLARRAIGGDSEIQKVRSMTIIGKATKTFETDGAAKSEQGDFELNFELPDKFQKVLKLRHPDGSADEDRVVEIVSLKRENSGKTEFKHTEGDGNNVVVTVTRGPHAHVSEEKSKDSRKVVIHRDLSASRGEDKMRHNEMLRTTLFLLLTAPEGVSVAYTYAGEASVDGAACDIIDAASNGESFKLYLEKSSHLPKMMIYQGFKPMMMKFQTIEKKPTEKGEREFTVFNEKIGEPEKAEFQVKFSNFKTVNGLKLPFTWTQTTQGKPDEENEISSYEFNPAGIAEKFREMQEKVMIRQKKPE